MDIAQFRNSVAGLIQQLYVLDPTTGIPTTTPMNAYARVPQSISETKLPCGVVFSGAAKYPDPADQGTDRLAREKRLFGIEFYLAMAEAGVDFDAEMRAEPYLNYTRDWLQSHIQLWDGTPENQSGGTMPDGSPRAGIKRTYVLSDSGLTSKLRFTTATVKFLGIAYVIQVDADNKVIYATNQ